MNGKVEIDLRDYEELKAKAHAHDVVIKRHGISGWAYRYNPLGFDRVEFDHKGFQVFSKDEVFDNLKNEIESKSKLLTEQFVRIAALEVENKNLRKYRWINWIKQIRK